MNQENATPDAENELPDDGQQAYADEAFAEHLSPEAVEASVDERVVRAEQEVLRVRAEMENFRKRMQRDTEQQLRYANMPLVRDLVDVVDNLNRAVSAAQGEGTAKDALLSGVEMVISQFSGVLSKFGCQPIQAQGAEFDPNIHEAISQMPSPEVESGHVMQEVAVGYMLHDRVVRPSQVIVSSGAPS
ncbi:MAG: nucleotide exchange factor GrpE [Planctomycetales bacterium]|nr:nucleotide exchange factor GrpE [Planctomycetales bacterium]